VFGWTADEATGHRILDAFVDAGGRSIDTADSYAAWVDGNTGGESETIKGNWLARTGKRDQVSVLDAQAPRLAGGSARPCTVG
jgi:aryl-alcohol dehydrogenase-like predicted oxidoreductase